MVRQMFQAGVLQSAFWHQFAMTAHSPVGMYPEKFKVKRETGSVGTFANNDIVHIDPTGADHDTFTAGLKKSLLNYMHGACLDYNLQKWFEFKVPKTSVAPDYIIKALETEEYAAVQPTSKIIWLGGKPEIAISTKSKNGNNWEIASLLFQGRRDSTTIKVDKQKGLWLVDMLQLLSIDNYKILTLRDVKDNFESNGHDDFELFWDNKPVNTLHKFGLLTL